MQGVEPSLQPHSPYMIAPGPPGARKSPHHVWPSGAGCQNLGKSSTRTRSLAPMAAGFPAHLLPPRPPLLKESCHLCTLSLPKQTAPGPSWEQTPVVGPHTQVGLKPELSPRGGVTKEEEQKSFCEVEQATA